MSLKLLRADEVLVPQHDRQPANSDERSLRRGGGRASRRVTTIMLVSAALTTLSVARESSAAVIWSSGFETNDFSDWDYELNPEGLSVVTDPVAAGQYAMRAELTRDRVWSNGIFRTELKYQPTGSKVSEGDETYFGWSVYLPAALPAGDYQLGYFETSTTYNQVFSLHAEGADIALVLNHEAAQGKHKVAGVLTPGAWHRIVYHVKWSADPAVGSVSVWWDGSKVVDQAKAQTFVDDDPAVIQLGLLKDPPEPPQPIVLFVDEAIDGQSYADVSLGIAEVVPVSPGTSPVGTDSNATSSAGTSTAGTSTSATSAPIGTPTTTDATGAATTTTAAPGGDGANKSSCSVHVPRHSSAAWSWSFWGATAALALAARKRWVNRGN